MSVFDFLALKEVEGGGFILPHGEHVLNYLGTIHGSAQFAYAEIATGDFLARSFPEYKDKVMVLLRKSTVKYSRPAKSALSSVSSYSKEDRTSLINRLEKGRPGILPIAVKLLDEEGRVTFSGTFEWHISLKNQD